MADLQSEYTFSQSSSILRKKRQFFLSIGENIFKIIKSTPPGLDDRHPPRRVVAGRVEVVAEAVREEVRVGVQVRRRQEVLVRQGAAVGLVTRARSGSFVEMAAADIEKNVVFLKSV
jgi:hypothetical protein